VLFHVTKVTLAARRIREILCQRAELSAAAVSPPMQVCVSPATDVWRHSLSGHEVDALQAYVC
jgi:hypothetical protein